MHASSGLPVPGQPIEAKPSARTQFTSTILVLEAFVVLFACFVAMGLQGVAGAGADAVPPMSDAAIWTSGGVLMAVLIILSRAVGSPAGLVAGSIGQVVVLATGFVVPMMWVVGGVFVVLWVISVRLGGRIDRERAHYDATHPDTAPSV
ncbi:DUF4233 domain-containing protein [Sanguibacter sp. A247]|uniref:DUF4233 domain-containing protein n=1 Tax=unclassified Sanguibacter TaxID=2645534 RepID=UPI003FD6D39C